MAPAFCLFSIYAAVFVSALFLPQTFYLITAALTFICVLWISNLALSSLVGAYRLRQGTSTNWQAALDDLPQEEVSSVFHIVILPNFRENERMLKETLENIGRSAIARTSIHVVLAMEAREGPECHEKADRLRKQTSHLFADVIATFHPEGIDGEVAGKSSNTQWAFRETLRQYGPKLPRDLSKVFLTVGDADTLWHPHYFAALTVQGLRTPVPERAWTIWQPPILLVRNIFDVPAMTRASAHATLIFELAALANQLFFPAFAYSAYSMTLALATHPEVDGWDVDVIAEDHHMFCKCYFAALWEKAHGLKDGGSRTPQAAITPQVKVQAIHLPAVSYLVQSSEGYCASLLARFQQARRHSQGVIELGYVFLQYARLVWNIGFMQLPMRTHTAIWSIALKIHTLHITSTAQCFALIMATISTFVPSALRWLLGGGLQRLLAQSAGIIATLQDSWGTLNLAQQALATSAGHIPIVTLLYSFTCWVVIRDLFDGRYYRLAKEADPARPSSKLDKDDSSSDCSLSPVEYRPELKSKDDASSDGSSTTAGSYSELKCKEGSNSSLSETVTDASEPVYVQGSGPWMSCIGLFLHIFSDTAFVGYSAIFFFAVIPVVLAAWSLFRRGTDFEYIVALKPE